MKFLKWIFGFFSIKPSIEIYSWKVIERDYNEISIGFNDGQEDYVVDLDWEDGTIYVEFGILGAKLFDTTNQHNHFRIMTTIAYAIRRITDGITKETGYKFHSLSFKSSDIRGGEVDLKSREVRTRFFMRYVFRQFPNAEISVGDIEVLIKLNRV